MGKSKQKAVAQPLPTVVYKPIPRFGAGCKNC